MPTEGAKLSGALDKSGTVSRHTSGESLKWAPKVQACHVKRGKPISQAKGRSKANI